MAVVVAAASGGGCDAGGAWSGGSRELWGRKGSRDAEKGKTEERERYVMLVVLVHQGE